MIQTNEMQVAPLISVVIPLYNKAPYIRRAIESVLKQTYQKFEILVVGGHSNDGGEDIVLEFNDSRIILIDEVGKGVSAARNQGINLSSGSLVSFLDADDYWPPRYLESILDLQRMFPNAGLYASGFRFVSNSTETPVHYHSLPESYYGIVPSYFQAVVLEGRDFLATSSITIPKATFEEVGYFNIQHSYNEDSELVGRIALKYPIAIDTRIKISYTTDSDNSLSRNPPAKYQHPFITIIENISTEDLVLRDDYASILEYLDKLYLTSAMINLWTYDDELYHQHISKIKTIDKFSKIRIGLAIISKIPISIRKMNLFREIIYRLKQII